MITPTQVEDIFEVESCCLTQDGFSLRIPQSLPHKFWDYEQMFHYLKLLTGQNTVLLMRIFQTHN